MAKKAQRIASQDHQLKVIQHANAMLWLWKELVDRSNGNSWFEVTARQAYQDCLNSLKYLGLIEDYDVTKVQVKVDGQWRSDRYVARFVADRSDKGSKQATT